MSKNIVIHAKSSVVSIIMRALGNYFYVILKLIGIVGKNNKSEEKKWKKPPFIGFTDLIRPWVIEIDDEKQMITTKKRNWYLIDVDEQNYLFNTVRQIYIDKHLFGADLYIRIYAGHANVFSLPKSEAERIKNHLLSRNKPRGGDIIIDID